MSEKMRNKLVLVCSLVFLFPANEGKHRLKCQKKHGTTLSTDFTLHITTNFTFYCYHQPLSVSTAPTNGIMTSLKKCYGGYQCLSAASTTAGQYKDCYPGGCDELKKEQPDTDFYYCQNCTYNLCNGETIPEVPPEGEGTTSSFVIYTTIPSVDTTERQKASITTISSSSIETTTYLDVSIDTTPLATVPSADTTELPQARATTEAPSVESTPLILATTATEEDSASGGGSITSMESTTTRSAASTSSSMELTTTRPEIPKGWSKASCARPELAELDFVTTNFTCYQLGITAAYFLTGISPKTTMRKCSPGFRCISAAVLSQNTSYYLRACYLGGCKCFKEFVDDRYAPYYCNQCHGNLCNNEIIPENP